MNLNLEFNQTPAGSQPVRGLPALFPAWDQFIGSSPYVIWLFWIMWPFYIYIYKVNWFPLGQDQALVLLGSQPARDLEPSSRNRLGVPRSHFPQGLQEVQKYLRAQHGRWPRRSFRTGTSGFQCRSRVAPFDLFIQMVGLNNPERQKLGGPERQPVALGIWMFNRLRKKNLSWCQRCDSVMGTSSCGSWWMLCALKLGTSWLLL